MAARSTLESVASAMGGQGALLVSGVIAARLLGPEDRGYLALVVLVPLIVCQLGLLGVANAVTYYVARDHHATATILRTTGGVALAQLILCSVVNALVIWLLVRDESRVVQSAGLVTLIVPAAFVVRSYGLAVLQGLQRFRPFNILRLVQPLVYSAVLVFLLFFDVLSLPIVAAAWSGSSVVAAALTVFAVLRAVPAVEPGAVVPSRGDLLRFGAKGFLGEVSPLETFRLDQAIVGLFLSPMALGLYVVSLAFTNLPRFMAQSVGMVAFPHIAGEPNDKVARRWTWWFFWLTLGSSLIVVLVLGAAAPQLIPLLFGEEFQDAVVPMRILLVGSLVFGVRRILGDGMRGRGYPAANTVAEIASWFCLLPAFAVLVPRLELTGVAIAVVSASVVSLGVLGCFMIIANNAINQEPPTNGSGSRFRLGRA